MGIFVSSPSPRSLFCCCRSSSRPPVPHAPPPSAAILRTLTTMVAHFLGAFPPLWRTDVVAAVKGVNLRLNKTVAVSSCAFSSVGRTAEWEWRHNMIFRSGGWCLFLLELCRARFILWGGGPGVVGEPAPGAVAVDDESRRSPALSVWLPPGPARRRRRCRRRPARAPGAPGPAGPRGRGRGGSRPMPRSCPTTRLCLCFLEVPLHRPHLNVKNFVVRLAFQKCTDLLVLRLKSILERALNMVCSLKDGLL